MPGPHHNFDPPESAAEREAKLRITQQMKEKYESRHGWPPVEPVSQSRVNAALGLPDRERRLIVVLALCLASFFVGLVLGVLQ